MAHIEVINLTKLSRDGFLQPVNSPLYVTPDNVTHARLYYNTFATTDFIQGTIVVTSNSTFQFSISESLGYSKFKLFLSTDSGVTYAEERSYGGDDGQTIDLTLNTSGFLTTNTTQTISSNKTVATGFQFKQTDAPNAATSVVNRVFVGKMYKARISQVSSLAPSVAGGIAINTLGATITFTRNGQGDYKCTASSAIFTAEGAGGFFSISPTILNSDDGGKRGQCVIDYVSFTSTFFNFYTVDLTETASDNILQYTNFEIWLPG